MDGPNACNAGRKLQADVHGWTECLLARAVLSNEYSRHDFVECRMSESVLRHGVRAAASVLLIACGVHATAHYRVYVIGDSVDASQRALMAAMQAHEILPRWHVTAWTMLSAYSLCFAVLLMFSGTLLWWMGKELPATRLRALAAAAALVLFIGVALLGLLAPAPVQMSILSIAALCLAAGSVFGAEARRLPNGTD